MSSNLSTAENREGIESLSDGFVGYFQKYVPQINLKKTTAVQNLDRFSEFGTKAIKLQISRVTTLRNNNLDRLLRYFERHWQLAN